MSVPGLFRILRIPSAFLAILFFSTCKKDSDKIVLQEPYYYFQIEFEGDTVRNESNDIHPSAYSRGPGEPIRAFNNSFHSPAGPYDIQWTINFKDSVSEGDILALEGKNLPIKRTGEYPYVRVYLVSHGGQDYCTDIDIVDYGPSTFIIDSVISWGTVYPFFTKPEVIARNYVLRGHCSFNVSRNFASPAEPNPLFPVTNGKFSLRVFVPPH